MALHFMLSIIICHHVKYASQTLHAITVQLLIVQASYQQTIVYTRDLICGKYFLLIRQLCLSIHEEQFKGLVGILSGKTCLCFQCSEASVLSIRILYIFVSFVLEKDSRESKSIKW